MFSVPPVPFYVIRDDLIDWCIHTVFDSKEFSASNLKIKQLAEEVAIGVMFRDFSAVLN